MPRTVTRFALVALTSLLFAAPVSAAEFAHQQNYMLAKDATIQDDLYVAANAPTISGTIAGDAVVAGGTVTIDGTIKNELLAAGGTVALLGHVGSTARIAGGTVTINGPVDGDLVVAGGTVSILPGATIGRDLVIVGGTVTINGTVARNITVRGSNVLINSTVGGTVDAKGSTISLGDQAHIKGALTYESQNNIATSSGATVASITRKPQSTSTEEAIRPGVPAIFGVIFGLALFAKLIAYGTALIILSIVFEDTSTAIVVEARRVWQSLGIGFAGLILIPLAAIILFISVFGSALGLVLIIAYALALVLAKLFAAIVAGAWLSKWFKGEYEVSWPWSLLALLILELLWLVPFIGWAAPVALFLITLGAILMQIYRYFEQS